MKTISDHKIFIISLLPQSTHLGGPKLINLHLTDYHNYGRKEITHFRFLCRSISPFVIGNFSSKRSVNEDGFCAILE